MIDLKTATQSEVLQWLQSDEANGPAMIELYNKYSDKPVKRFSSLSNACQRIRTLADKVREAKPKAAPTDHSAAIAETWRDPKVKAKRSERHAVRVNGQEYRSVRAAFVALDLPLEKHIKFRMRLKHEGSLTEFGHTWFIIEA